MAAPVKKRTVNENSNFNGNDGKSESSDESSENGYMEEYINQEIIQVDFEGRNPVDADFHGIKQLLQQLFLKAHINLSELADLIIGQNYVGSVVKQSEVDSEDGDDDSDVNDVFGVTSVLNITEKQNLECVQQLRSLLLELCSEHATDQANTLIRSLLSDDSQSIGLLINERIVNIPAQISVPLLESLSKEIKRACEKKMPYDFTYFILICKLYRSEKPQTKKKKKKKQQQSGGGDEPEVVWSNLEEEIINQEADCQFEFCVKGDSDSGLVGHWMEDDVEMSPYRRVLLLKANKLDPLIERIKTSLSQQ
ncbi:BCCIP-like protein [Cryptotermes secundus]|uniref:Protein BCCIP homolog n=2 Tax=Cryptotermes secundus TaxID=105785 RepID=A0A2J7PJQ7_9NEOP|nr:protein BCCIP homolog [Cryptotermes secundus]PNF16572.1 BCCIP-like protein [Cryptotermes secundus]